MYNKTVCLQYHVPVFVLISIIALISGCATPPPVTTEQPGFHELGRIGIISPVNQPKARIDELPPAGAVNGAISGSIAGSFAGAFECLLYLYPFLPAYPLCVAALTMTGLGAGVVLAESPELVDMAQELFTHVLAERDWQATLRENLVMLTNKETSISVTDLGAQQLTDNAMLTTKADTLIEVTLIKLSTWSSGDHKFGFVLTGQSQLIRSADMVVLTSTTHQFVSNSVPLSEWVASDGTLIRDSLAAGVDYLAKEIIHEHLN